MFVDVWLGGTGFTVAVWFPVDMGHGFGMDLGQSLPYIRRADEGSCPLFGLRLVCA